MIEVVTNATVLPDCGPVRESVTACKRSGTARCVTPKRGTVTLERPEFLNE